MPMTGHSSAVFAHFACMQALQPRGTALIEYGWAFIKIGYQFACVDTLQAMSAPLQPSRYGSLVWYA